MYNRIDRTLAAIFPIRHTHFACEILYILYFVGEALAVRSCSKLNNLKSWPIFERLSDLMNCGFRIICMVSFRSKIFSLDDLSQILK